MNYYLDADFISKLASFDLFDEFFSVYSISKNDIRILDIERKNTLGRIKNNNLPIDRKNYNVSLVEGFEEISFISNKLGNLKSNLFNLFSNTENIDIGEQTLLFYAQYSPSLIFTGDHRFLKRIIFTPSLLEALQFIKHRIFILEQVLIKIIQNKTLNSADIRDKLFNGRQCDKALYDIIYNRNINEDQLLEKLEFRINQYGDFLYQD